MFWVEKEKRLLSFDIEGVATKPAVVFMADLDALNSSCCQTQL